MLDSVSWHSFSIPYSGMPFVFHNIVAIHQPFYSLHSIFVILFFFSFLFVFSMHLYKFFYFISDTVHFCAKGKITVQARIGWPGCWNVSNLSMSALGYRRGVVEYELLLCMLKVNVNLTMDCKITSYYSKMVSYFTIHDLTLPISQFGISDLMKFVIKSNSFKHDS